MNFADSDHRTIITIGISCVLVALTLVLATQAIALAMGCLRRTPRVDAKPAMRAHDEYLRSHFSTVLDPDPAMAPFLVFSEGLREATVQKMSTPASSFFRYLFYTFVIWAALLALIFVLIFIEGLWGSIIQPGHASLVADGWTPIAVYYRTITKNSTPTLQITSLSKLLPSNHVIDLKK